MQQTSDSVTVTIFYYHSKFSNDDLLLNEYNNDTTDREEPSYNYSTNDYFRMYAFTTKKKYAKKFRKLRRMKFFTEETIDMDIDYFRHFSKMYEGYELDRYNLITREYNDGKEVASCVDIISNQVETEPILYNKSEVISKIMSCDSIELVSNLFDKNIFNDRLSKILEDVYFIDNLLDDIYPTEDPIYNEVPIDELALFITLYYDILDLG